MTHVDDIFNEDFSFSYPLFNVRQVFEYLTDNYTVVKPITSKRFKVTDANRVIEFTSDYKSIRLYENKHIFFEGDLINPEALVKFVYNDDSYPSEDYDYDDWAEYDSEIYEYDDDEENYRI